MSDAKPATPSPVAGGVDLEAVPLVWWCPQCGYEPKSDEDGCCATCGCTVGEVPDSRALISEVRRLQVELERVRPAVEAWGRLVELWGLYDCECERCEATEEVLAAYRKVPR